MKVGVFGGGLAGLAVSYLLREREIAVEVHEAKASVGGRVRSMPCRSARLDAGQHIFTDASTSLLNLIRRLGIDHQFRAPDRMSIPIINSGTKREILDLGAAAGRIDYVRGLWRLSGLTWREKARLAVLLGSRTEQGASRIPQLFSAGGQLPIWFDNFSRSLLATPLARVDHLLLVSTLKQLFQGAGARLRLPKLNMENSLIKPLEFRLQDQIHTRSRLEQVERDLSGAISRVWLNGSEQAFDYYVFALPPERTSDLFDLKLPVRYAPVRTLFFRTDSSSNLGWMNMLLNGDFEWVIDCGGTGDDERLYAAVHSGDSPHDEDVSTQFARLPQALGITANTTMEGYLNYVRAVPVQDREFQQARERIAYCGVNWSIIGAWADPGLPVTMEAAVRSAYQVADRLS